MKLPWSERALLSSSCAILLAGVVVSLAQTPSSLSSESGKQGDPTPAAIAPEKPESSPVQLFRELLAMSQEEQKQFLAEHYPQQERRILAKVREYESLRPNQRELRLRATELRWYLWPLLFASATNRVAQVAAIPEDFRALVEDRLAEWDKLPAAAQRELIDNEATLRYFTQVEPATEEQKQALMKTISPARRAKLEAGIASWRRLPDYGREKELNRFNQFFELSPAEQEKALRNISDEERRQIEKTLRRFAELPPEQREECINAFARFTAMSLEEREQFLKNAKRWQFMSPDERQEWRDLVAKLPPDAPPFPPGLEPPIPPTLPGNAGTPASAVATNTRN